MLRKAVFVLGAVAILAAGPAFAQGTQSPSASTSSAAPASGQSGPGSIPVGPLTVYPGVDLAHGYDDNLFMRQTDLKSSSYTVLSPSVRAELKTGPHKFDFAMRIDDGRMHSSPADSYTDYSLIGNGDVVFSARAGLKVRAEHRHGHDGRGSTDRGFSPSPDEYDNTGIDGLFRYGAPGARGRIEVDAAAYMRRYTNNRASTAAADRDTSQLGGTFYWRVMPRTDLLAQVGRRSIDYELGSSTLDSTEMRYLAGVKWEATAATTGMARFGRQTKKFDSAAREDFSGSSWDVGVRWSPLTYSVFDFTTSKQTGESTGVGDTVVAKSFGVVWSHAWNSRLRTQALANYRNEAFVGSGSTRVDDNTSFGLKVGYDFRRWLKLGAEFTHSERDSNGIDLNYKRNLLLFTVGATL